MIPGDNSRHTIELKEETILKLKRHHMKFYGDYDTYDDIIIRLLEFYESKQPVIRQYMIEN